MAKLVDRFQPSFALYPLNNNRTGYQPVNQPLLLIVPFTRTIDGLTIANAGVTDVVFFVEDAPGKVPVAGFQNRGIFVPDFERFRIEIDATQLASVRIDPTGQQFQDRVTGEIKSFDEVSPGDLMEYTLLRGMSGAFGRATPGPRDTIPYFSDAEYYDLSPFIIESVDLPVNRYNFTWQCRYFKRLITSNGELICIDDSKAILARFSNMLNHPGEIHQAMLKNSPAFYFNSPSLDRDNTVAFYRPFADALQDIFDEQLLLKGINWVDKIPIQFIPYLSNLLGLDLPYFPSTTDEIRRAVLRNGRRLQQLKGSKRAIRELFEIFGFTIDIANLWYSQDGRRFVAPNEQLPSDIEDQEITTEDICHSEPMVVDFDDPGFGQFNVPLLFKPLGNLTVDAYLVQRGSAAEQALQDAVDATAADVEAFTTDSCAVTIAGFQSSTFQASIPTDVVSHSTILIDQNTGGIEEVQVGIPVVNKVNVRYDRDNNIVDVNFDHYLGFIDDTVVYIFVTYERRKIILPKVLEDLRSNRFDINILLFKDGEQPTSDVLDFLIEFLFRFKAFHSLLRKILYSVEVCDVYNVQDFCAGGRQVQAPDSDFGQIQLPPPVIPQDVILDPDDPDFKCDEESIDPGYKQIDLDFRAKIQSQLEIEHASWKSLDGSHDVPPELLPILQSATRLKIRLPDNGDCQFTQYGQDRIFSNGEKDFDHHIDDRAKLCDLEGNVDDYCYRGRVQQDLIVEPILTLEETFRCKPCKPMPGIGEYYMAPIVLNDEFSGGDNGPNLTDILNYNRSRHDRGYTRVMAFDNPQLHFSDRDYVEDLDSAVNNRFFATRRPSLDIEKDNMFFPGHRLISMVNLENNLVHPEYKLRPWDDIFDILCPEDLPDGAVVPDLDPHLIDDNQFLVYNVADLVYYGNGIPADIPSMDDHTVSNIPVNDITHNIWSSSTAGLCWSRGLSEGSKVEYAIDHSTDGLRFPTEALGTFKDTICFTDELGPIFASADRDCPCPEGSNVFVAEDLENIETTGVDITTITGTDRAIGGADFIDGYPAEFGPYTENLFDFDFPREEVSGYGFLQYDIDLYGDPGGTVNFGPAIALGVPLIVTDENVRELMFKVGSGIRVREPETLARFHDPLRLDCGCEKFECDIEDVAESVVAVGSFGRLGFGVLSFGGALEIVEGVVSGEGCFGQLGFGVLNFGDCLTEEEEEEEVSIVRCPIDLFKMPDGSFDFNCDRVELIPTMILDEQYGAKTCILDGSIPNMMHFDDEKINFSVFTTDPEIIGPEEGAFQFIDDYGVIYRTIFETFNDRIDYTLQTQDPRVWGQPPTGEVKNRRVFRDGVVTSERQIIQVNSIGYVIIAEGAEQNINRFQTTFGCGDEVFENPFAFAVDNAIVDDVIFVITSVTTGSDPVVISDFGGEDFGEGDFGD